MIEQQQYKDELLNYIYECANNLIYPGAKIRKLIVEHQNINLGSYDIQKFTSNFNYEKSIIDIENANHLVSVIFSDYKVIQKSIVCKMCVDLLNIKAEDLMLYYSFTSLQVKSRCPRVRNKLKEDNLNLNTYLLK